MQPVWKGLLAIYVSETRVADQTIHYAWFLKLEISSEIIFIMKSSHWYWRWQTRIRLMRCLCPYSVSWRPKKLLLFWILACMVHMLEFLPQNFEKALLRDHRWSWTDGTIAFSLSNRNYVHPFMWLLLLQATLSFMWFPCTSRCNC